MLVKFPLMALLLSFLQIASCLAQESITFNALPANGRVVAGKAKITQINSNSHSVLMIEQTSDRAIIELDSFALGKDSIINLRVPQASSGTLVRVVGDSISQINGKIHSNGQLTLTFPASKAALLP